MLPLADARSGYPPALRSCAELVRSLSEADLAVPTRCAGWTVADVAAHIAGGITDVATGRLDDAGAPSWTARQVAERKGRSAAELADEIDGGAKLAADLLAAFDEAAWAGPAPAGYNGPLGEGACGMWADAVIHADDIRRAVGRSSEWSAPGVHASVDHVADLLAAQGWGPAALALDGLPEIAVGAGGGRRVTGDPVAFLLATTGRGDLEAFGLGPEANVFR